ncbi:class I SAM-dependent methyltransferase [Leeuwenhoekiella sp. MAR_2009_132]|uniref:class I SAM-dependent methyltransferase n=1 Tax=Leeuwenhoekiella sp. MAR_2009_132 TaxID=1392489 RepID=UPI0005646847|nr:class I SAM-dependent methyltransferase [Leeuwenhoekiella sp. MAR_2009_132]
MSSSLDKKTTIKIKDFSVSNEEFDLIYDSELDMYITSSIPENLEDYYLSENYISHTDSKKGITETLYQFVKSFMLKQKLKHISKFKSVGSLLDIGAGTGDFLIEAKKRGWEVTGVEPSSVARKNALNKKLTLLENTSQLTTQKFDVITMWHVLEHVPHLQEQINWLERHLSEDGILVIAVPNFNSDDAKKYGKFWAAWDVPRHIHHFSRKSITTLFSNFGFELIVEKPLIFDSFYVSLLSEKYMKGKSNLIMSFLSGLSSNWKARRSGEYSSLIYTFKEQKT